MPETPPAGPVLEVLNRILAAQQVQPYRGWNITELNKAADEARELLSLPSVRDLNPDIAVMQDHAAANKAALSRPPVSSDGGLQDPVRQYEPATFDVVRRHFDPPPPIRDEVEQVAGEVIQADRIRGESVYETVFFLTRHAAALAVEDGRKLCQQHSLWQKHPEFAVHLENLFDGISVKICEVRQDSEVIDQVASAFAAHRLKFSTARSGGDDEGRVERVARAIDPEAWVDDLPVPTRDDVMTFHTRRQKSIAQARAALAALDGVGGGG